MSNDRNKFIRSLDLGGLYLSLSGVVLGILFAVSDYHVAWDAALSLVGTTVLLHFYMATGGRIPLLLSVAGAVLTAWLSFDRILLMESLLLLLFGYFIIRLAKGTKGSSPVMRGVLDILLHGPIAVFGAYFVCTHTFGSWVLLFPSFSIGLLCAGAKGLGEYCGRNLCTVMICAGLLFMTAFSFLRMYALSHFMYMLTVPLFILVMVPFFLYKGEDMYVFKLLFSVLAFCFALIAGIGFMDIIFAAV